VFGADAEGQLGNDNEFSELESCGGGVLAGLREVILLSAAGIPEEAMVGTSMPTPAS
jgi:hypothetical protein